jgi:hypothetical protein
MLAHILYIINNGALLAHLSNFFPCLHWKKIFSHSLSHHFVYSLSSPFLGLIYRLIYSLFICLFWLLTVYYFVYPVLFLLLYWARSVRPSSLFTFVQARGGWKGRRKMRYEEKNGGPSTLLKYVLTAYFLLPLAKLLPLTNGPKKKTEDGRAKDISYFLLLLRLTDWAPVSHWLLWYSIPPKLVIYFVFHNSTVYLLFFCSLYVFSSFVRWILDFVDIFCPFRWFSFCSAVVHTFI